MAKLGRSIIVYGMVQGVGFRYFVQRLGRRLGLTGNVSNLPDGTVEIVAEGDAGPLDEFAREVEKGPPMARVERLDVRNIAVSGRYPTFMIEGW